MSAIRFLTALAKSVHSKLFSDDSTLKQVYLQPFHLISHCVCQQSSCLLSEGRMAFTAC